MKVLCWHGTGDVRLDTVADPTIQDPRDGLFSCCDRTNPNTEMAKAARGGPTAPYKTFGDNEDDCIEVVLKP